MNLKRTSKRKQYTYKHDIFEKNTLKNEFMTYFSFYPEKNF